MRRRVSAIATAEILAWAGFYYSFPALLPHWEQALDWSKATLSGAFTLALVVSAVAAPLAGRLIDRGHGAPLLTSSVVAGALLLAVLSQVNHAWQFYAIWAALGLVMAGALYEPCFAHLTHILGAGARAAITTVTLIAGFAGTVAFPTAHWLAESFGWRNAVLGFALLAGLVASPLMWFGARAGTVREQTPVRARVRLDSEMLSRAMRKATFWLLAIAFAMVALNHGMLITHLLPLLEERSIAPALAVLAASMIGPMQVVGRIAMLAAGTRLSIATVCVVSFLFMTGAAGLLYAAATIPILVLGFVLLQGSGYGVTSITKPVVTAEFLGREGFGAISGVQATAYMGAFAAAPALGAFLWEHGGYDLVIGSCAALAAGALVCFTGAARLR
ncbi:MAG: MFS transporter [Gammaproteobacteria bacterium]